MKKVLGIVGILVAGFLVLSIIMISGESMTEKRLEKAREEMETALNNNDFAAAFSAARTLDEEEFESYRKVNVPRVADAQVGYLLAEGEFDLAHQIAQECNIPDKYYNKILPNLMSIAQKHGNDQAIAAMMSCTLPIRGKRWGELYISDDASFGGDERWKQFITTHNNYIDRFMGYLQISGDIESIKKCALFLNDTYEGGTKEVAKIKAKYGIR